MKKHWKCFLIATSIIFIGCHAMTFSGNAGVYPLDYDTPESAFANVANAGLLGSAFIEDYAGKYVVFECAYTAMIGHAIVDIGGRPVIMRDISTVHLWEGGDIITVLWHPSDREIVRPLAGLAVNSKVRVFAYVLPAGQRAKPKSRDDVVSKPFSKPYLWLIRVVPSGDKARGAFLSGRVKAGQGSAGPIELAVGAR